MQRHLLSTYDFIDLWRTMIRQKGLVLDFNFRSLKCVPIALYRYKESSIKSQVKVHTSFVIIRKPFEEMQCYFVDVWRHWRRKASFDDGGPARSGSNLFYKFISIFDLPFPLCQGCSDWLCGWHGGKLSVYYSSSPATLYQLMSGADDIASIILYVSGLIR